MPSKCKFLSSFLSDIVQEGDKIRRDSIRSGSLGEEETVAEEQKRKDEMQNNNQLFTGGPVPRYSRF